MREFKSLVLVLTVFLFLGVTAQAAPEIYAIGNESEIDDRPCCNTLAEGDPRAEEQCRICGPVCCNEEVCGPCFPDEASESRIIEPFEFGPSSLYKIDPETGAPTLIGSTGYVGCQGLEIHPETDELFAVCNPILNGHLGQRQIEEEGGPVLVKLNPFTGQGTEVGPLGLGEREGVFVSDISFLSNGELYAYVVSLIRYKAEDSDTKNGVVPLFGNSLGIIDTETGYLKIIGPTFAPDNYSAISFDSFQELKQCANINDLVVGPGPFPMPVLPPGPIFNEIDLGLINIHTGASQRLGSIFLPPHFEEEHINRLPSKDTYFEGRIFYGILNSRDFPEQQMLVSTNTHGPEGSFLITIGEDTGVVEVLGQISDPDQVFTAIAVNSKFARAVPTMSEYGLMATGVLLLGAAVIYLRRRQASSQI